MSLPQPDWRQTRELTGRPRWLRRGLQWQVAIVEPYFIGPLTVQRGERQLVDAVAAAEDLDDSFVVVDAVALIPLALALRNSS